MIEVNDDAHLEALPDGSIIRWLRIPGDPTSEAVAFVRVEMTWDDRAPTESAPPLRTVWISPGGWQPMSIAEAQIHYPVHVVHLGAFNPAHWPNSEAPLIDADNGLHFVPGVPMEVTNLAHGGTWPREAALAAAAQVFQGNGRHLHNEHVARYVTDLADRLVAWLDPDPTPEPPETMNYLGQQTRLMEDDLGEVLKPENSSGRSVLWRAQQLIERGWRR